MKISAAAAVVAPRERLFEALNNPDVLRRCIPGCEELTAEGSDTYRVRLKLGVAGLTGQYAGKVTYQNLQPPESFTLAFDGKGKTGFVRGIAAVSIADDQGTARVDCEADVQVGGAIAAVGSRLMVAARPQAHAGLLSSGGRRDRRRSRRCRRRRRGRRVRSTANDRGAPGRRKP